MASKINISAGDVKNLREQTGASIMECKKALEKSNGNFEMAEKYLKQSGKEKAGKKSDRETREGVIAAYIHSNKKVGAVVELRCETDFVAKNAEFQELAYDIAMHVAAMSPKYITLESVAKADRSEYEKMVREEAVEEKKPENIVDKIVEGRVQKHYAEISLLSQAYIKNSEITIEDLLKEKIAKIGENIQITRFERFEI
jgi:elongation factor Ts